MKHVIISGDVQGVGFRQYIKYQAKKLNIKGWIKNLPDENVEAMYSGDPKNVETLIEISHKGPFLARVDSVEVEELDDEEFEDFRIIKN